MASGDYLDLATEACYAARLDPADSTDLARAKKHINSGYISTVGDGTRWSFLEVEGQFTTSAGSDTYTYTSIATALSVDGIEEIRSIVNDTTGYSLDSMSWEALEHLVASSQDNEGTGEPVIWAKWGTGSTAKIRLFPSPDQVYTLGAMLVEAPNEMSGDTDTPRIPLRWRQRILVPYAAWKLLREEGGADARSEADRHKQDYEEAYQQMLRALGQGREPTMRQAAPDAFDAFPRVDIGAYDW